MDKNYRQCLIIKEIDQRNELRRKELAQQRHEHFALTKISNALDTLWCKCTAGNPDDTGFPSRSFCQNVDPEQQPKPHIKVDTIINDLYALLSSVTTTDGELDNENENENIIDDIGKPKSAMDIKQTMSCCGQSRGKGNSRDGRISRSDGRISRNSRDGRISRSDGRISRISRDGGNVNSRDGGKGPPCLLEEKDEDLLKQFVTDDYYKDKQKCEESELVRKTILSQYGPAEIQQEECHCQCTRYNGLQDMCEDIPCINKNCSKRPGGKKTESAPCILINPAIYQHCMHRPEFQAMSQKMKEKSKENENDLTETRRCVLKEMINHNLL